MSEFFNEKSKSRAIVYAALVGTATMFAFYLDWSAEELNLWITYIGLILPAMGLTVASIRTWPKRVEHESESFTEVVAAFQKGVVSSEAKPCTRMHGTGEPHIRGCEGWTSGRE